MAEQQAPAAAAPEQRAMVPEKVFRHEITQMQPQFAMVLPTHIPPEKFVRVAMTAVMQSPDLLKMDRKLLIQELMLCATDGLIPDKREAVILPFKGKPKYLPMVGGILKKMRNSGELKSIHPMVVYANDEFDYWVDENGPHLKHTPTLSPDAGPVRLSYCVLQTKDGGTYIEVITEQQMDKIRKASASGENGPWGGPFVDEMRKKSTIKRISKRSPMSTDLEDLLSRDEDVTDPKPEPAGPMQYQTIDVTASQPDSAASTPAADHQAAQSATAAHHADVNAKSAMETQAREAARPAAREVFNHAPNSTNPPPAKSDQPSAGPAAAGPEKAGALPSRESMAIKIPELCKRIGWKPAEAKERILKMCGKPSSELLDVEMQLLIEELETTCLELNA